MLATGLGVTTVTGFSKPPQDPPR